MNSIGMIETRGLIAAIEAADIMVKSSNVNLISKQKIGAGLVTITVEGDVGAVRAAVDAAEEGVHILGCELISSHVIPSPSKELEVFFDDEKIKQTVKVIETEYEENSEKIELFSTINREGFEELVEKYGLEKSIESIKHMTLTNIRKLAKEYETLSLSDTEVAKASKKKVIEAIKNCQK